MIQGKWLKTKYNKLYLFYNKTVFMTTCFQHTILDLFQFQYSFLSRRTLYEKIFLLFG